MQFDGGAVVSSFAVSAENITAADASLNKGLIRGSWDTRWLRTCLPRPTHVTTLRELTGSTQGHWHWQCEANSEAAQQPADPEAQRSQQSCLPCAATAPTHTVVSVEHASTDRPFGARGEGAAVRSHAELAMNRSLSPPS